jgi:hypothetical protein
MEFTPVDTTPLSAYDIASYATGIAMISAVVFLGYAVVDGLSIPVKLPEKWQSRDTATGDSQDSQT